MRKPPNYRPIKDERDEQIETHSKSFALEFVVTAAEILTVLCLIKGNSAWKGSLGIVFLGMAMSLIYKYGEYREKPYVQVGIGLGLIGIALFIWFGVTG